MKIALCLFLLIVAFGCNSPSGKTVINKAVSVPKMTIPPGTILNSKDDSVNVATVSPEKIYYSKAELKKILKYYPELNDQFPAPPNPVAKMGVVQNLPTIWIFRFRVKLDKTIIACCMPTF